jgi:LCP family protein required for cell wall assembly
MSKQKKSLVGALVVLVLLYGVGVGAGWFLYNRYFGEVERIAGVFSGLDESSRPPAAKADASGKPPTTFLLMGTDSLAAGQTTGRDATAVEANARSDSIMLMRLSGSGGHVDVVSLPRDSWVDIPGHGMNKINAAYAYGGPTLLVQVVEQLTAVRVDHFAIIDSPAFVTLTDALGGVTVTVTTASTNLGYTFEPGRQVMDGNTALAYVRQRYDLPNGDFDRSRRQHAYLAATLATLRAQNTWTDAATLDKAVRAVTGALTVNAELGDLELLGYARKLRSLKPSNLLFLGAPVANLGWEGEQSVVYLDDTKARSMWEYFTAGTLADHIGEFPHPTLS